MVKVTLNDVVPLCRSIGNFLRSLGTALKTEKVWAWGLCLCIPVAIITDVFIQHNIQPIEYARAENVATATPVMIEVRVNWTRERIDKEIEAKAKEYGTSAATLKRIVQCESDYVTDVQSNHRLSYGREQSYGLAQIHLPSHPDVTYEQAIDPAFAIDYLAKHYANGTDKWSCK